MFKSRYICCVILISNIYGARLDGNISNGESMNEEDNEIEGKYEKTFKVNFENDEIDRIDSHELIEHESEGTEKVKKFCKETNNATVCQWRGVEDEDEVKDKSKTKMDDSETITEKEPDEDELKDKLNDKIEDSERVTEKAPVGDEAKDPSSEEDSTNKTILNDHHEDAKKLLFRNCRDRVNDDLCRNTLIDYPFAASIQRLGAHYATGALLDRRWILTVAEEFYNIRESIKLFRVRLGSVSCKRGGVAVPLQEVTIHPLFVPGKAGYDLGLVRLGEPVTYSDYIKPIRLSVAKERVLSAKFLTTYWPRLIVKGEVLPQNASERIKSTSLRVSTQKLISGQYCQKMMLDMNEHLQEASLCLKPLVTHHSLCMPDPGAPVVADDGLWGITSGWTSRLCHKLPGPTIFTRISAPLVRSWLDSKLLEV